MSDHKPWSEYPDDELRELIADARKDAEGPDGMPRVRTPPGGVNFFPHDPSGHLVVMHRSKIVDMADCLDALLTRAQAAEKR